MLQVTNHADVEEVVLRRAGLKTRLGAGRRSAACPERNRRSFLLERGDLSFERARPMGNHEQRADEERHGDRDHGENL